ncbi:uncharacterized protein HMPREF1541_10758 [Cyphellophora europaea CBS 101466]|uniref:Histone transcription regulator 3 homolog n=1 Tax=Cyphellophora europaea (strain CBS 101466) TaxID=1220924 RepID=W2S681_CYPE1|nr:uncharacterized protein HMPREF1541_10758 [Cyphellophora europaea CBS 101466]ETN44207.1 hypothetical protein HMPREF1541_10758 [Cyphellophora europaea CBS 101466]
MHGFKPLNVDSESEDEVDDTKEIQIEEANKAYNHALKLHSQGPSYLAEAKAAYEVLFQSEIFKYPEALSEFALDQVDDAPVAAVLPTDDEPVAVLPSNAADSSASLPQIVHLSFKNRGQLALDEARYNVQDGLSRSELRQYYSAACKTGLTNFAEALERDDADIDLWKKAARVAEILSTPRIARFCLESVLAGDDDGLEQTIDLSGLDEAFAAGELRDVIALLQDDLAQLRTAGIHPKPKLLSLVRKTNDPCPYLPKRISEVEYIKQSSISAPASHIALRSDTMTSLGNEIHQLITKHLDGDVVVSAQTMLSMEHREAAYSPAGMDKEEFVDAAEEIAGTPAEQSNIADAAVTDGSEQAEPINQVAMEEALVNENPEPSAEVADEELHLIPTRKRSSTVAGNEEPEGRVKSKRLRARESMLEMTLQDEDAVPEMPAHQSWNWTVLKSADADMLKTVDTMLSKLELPQFGSAENILAGHLTPDCHTTIGIEITSSRQTLASDLSTMLKIWSDEHSQALLHGHGNQDFVEKSAGLTLFMQHLKVSQDVQAGSPPAEGFDDVANFASQLENSTATLYEAVLLWLSTLLTSRHQDGNLILSSYLRDTWSGEMKQIVVQLLIRSEEQLYTLISQMYRALSENGMHDSGTSRWRMQRTAELTELVLTIFELHIDIHSRITNPISQVQHNTRIEQTDRLERWAAMTDDFVQLYTHLDKDLAPTSDLLIRFLWATTVYAGKADDIDRNHVMTCLQDLKSILQKLDTKPISLPNNAAMPLLSASAAEQELFRLSTLDFFMSVFDADNSDSVAVIEKLEPLLEADSSPTERNLISPESEAGKLIQFLNSGDASLRLFLWRRLQNAYTTISYTPKVVSCLFRAVETIVNELQRVTEEMSDEHERQITELKWLKDVDDLLARILSKVIGEPTALEVMDEAHLRSSLTAVTFLLRLVHVHALHEDNLRFGYTAVPQFKGAASTKLYEKSKDRLREMQVHLWTLQYILLKEATAQIPELFPDRANDLADYLCTTHHALGQRHYCRYANKQFVRLVKLELNSLETTNNYLGDMAQVMFDLYQLRFKISEGDFDHGCPHENLDKKTANSLVPMVMTYAKQLSIKDLLKSELRNTIDKVQTASGSVKSGPVVLQNRKLMTTYLKSQLIPEKFYKAYKGQGGLVTKSLAEDDSTKANYGWYFLLGHITLAKYRAVKRVSPTPTDDLDQAASLLRQDLEYNLEKWESWWRLAQIYDIKIEDDLIWNSTKLNDSRGDIAQLERNSINAYLMAITMAMRMADDNVETGQKLEDMFREFAIRLYASSRPPLNMEAFKTDKHMRHLSNSVNQSMSKVPLRAPWTSYQLWRFAARLLQKKFVNKPKPWASHYYRHKCLWKIYQSPENASARHPVTPEQVVGALVESIEALPHVNKSSEVILEPHMRMVSLMHKMVLRSAMTPHQGYQALQASRFAQGVHLAEDEDGPDWERYLLNILKKLSSADKANWQHRIINRAAHIIYDSEQSMPGALGAKHEFTQQVFTKTMTYQVWKPEFERAGRHYVYTGAYVTFFAHLLDQLNDRANMDQLVRRVRRKYTDFIDHTKIWENLCVTYVRLLRRIGKIPEGKERALFDNISFEEFSRLSEKVEQWALEPDNTSTVLDVMRDTIELKKLNNSLLKGGVIDDMIGDAYACLYETFVSQLTEEERAPPPPPAPVPGSFINMTTNAVGPDGKPTDGTPTLPGNVPGEPGQSIPAASQPYSGAPGLPQDPAQPTRAVPPNKPGRAKTITRREVQRKAEAAIAKPPPIKTPTLSKRPVIEIAMSDGVRRSASPASPSGDVRLDRLRDENGDGMDSAVTSRRNSVQGSLDNDGENDADREAGNEADDESELSDINEDDEEPEDTIEVGSKRKQNLFPGLSNRISHDSASSDADDDDDGDEDEEDGEGQGEGDGEEDEGEEGGRDGQAHEDAMAVDDDGEMEIQDSQQADDGGERAIE